MYIIGVPDLREINPQDGWLKIIFKKEKYEENQATFRNVHISQTIHTNSQTTTLIFFKIGM